MGDIHKFYEQFYETKINGQLMIFGKKGNCVITKIGNSKTK